MSADERSIHERMVAVLANLPPLGKDSYNEQQRFHYRGFDSMMVALNPLLAEHGVFVIPDVIDRVADRRTTAKGSAMYEVNLHVRFTFYGLKGDSVSASGWGEGTDMGDKATNKAMTAAFKYVLNQAFAISNEEARDADGGTPEETVARGGNGRASSTADNMRPATVEAIGEYLAEVGAAGFDTGNAQKALVKDSGGGPVLALTLERHRRELKAAIEKAKVSA